jgi:hypothetical protein
MDIRWLRIILAGFIAEALPIVTLVILVAIFGPPDQAGAEEFATRLGSFVGPIGGAFFALLLAFWGAHGVKSRLVLHGLLVGLFAAVLDASILVASAAPFRWIFVLSGIGRIVAGLLGGYLVLSRRPNN